MFDTKKDIMPCVIIGTKKAMPIDKFFYLIPYPLQMLFLPPVSSENKEVKKLKEEVYSKMVTVFTEKTNIKNQ